MRKVVQKLYIAAMNVLCAVYSPATPVITRSYHCTPVNLSVDKDEVSAVGKESV